MLKMRVLDRERYWSFMKAYFLCFSALIGLSVALYAFSNLDELMVVSNSNRQLLLHIGDEIVILCTTPSQGWIALGTIALASALFAGIMVAFPRARRACL
jgi:hypothetical protein